MRAIIMANGTGSRFGSTGVTKHELVIDGETLLGRQVRLLKAHGVDDIVISGPYPDYDVRSFIPTDEVEMVDGRLSVRKLWSPTTRTLILMGDVFYTDAAMSTIALWPGPEPRLFCRFTGSRCTGKPDAEIWANSFMPEHRAAHEASLRKVYASAQPRPGRDGMILRAGLWESYLLDHGMRQDQRPSPWWVGDLGDATVIDDQTEDFDYPSDYARFLLRHRSAPILSQIATPHEPGAGHFPIRCTPTRRAGPH